MENISIRDDSGDRKYFTQIPNYIANHSTANDQALYFQMKRYAGEDGKCFATQETLMERLGIGRKAYNKSLKYLLDKNWVKFIGMTGGKTRPIKTYSIVDIWKLNVLEYEEIPAERAVSFKQEIPAESNRDTGQKNSKIPAERAVEEEPYKQEPLTRVITNTPYQIARSFFNDDIKRNGMITEWFGKSSELLTEVTKFVDYWTELNKSGTKQRWQLEKTFEVKRRLNTWFSRSKSFQGYGHAEIVKEVVIARRLGSTDGLKQITPAEWERGRKALDKVKMSLPRT